MDKICDNRIQSLHRTVFVVTTSAMFFCGACDNSLDLFEGCPDEISLSSNTLTVKIGRNANLYVKRGSELCYVYWTNDNFQVIGMSTDNKWAGISARNVGQATVRAYRGYDDQGPSAACLVRVVPTTLTGMVLYPDSLTVVAQSQASQTLSALLIDDEQFEIAFDSGIEWASSDTSIANAFWTDRNFAHIRGYQVGSAVITATYRDSGPPEQTFSATAIVEVVPPE
jgi:hypothetical protein